MYQGPNARRQLLPEAGALAQAVGSQLHALVGQQPRDTCVTDVSEMSQRCSITDRASTLERGRRIRCSSSVRVRFEIGMGSNRIDPPSAES
jgi:hypothetical protein